MPSDSWAASARSSSRCSASPRSSPASCLASRRSRSRSSDVRLASSRSPVGMPLVLPTRSGSLIFSASCSARGEALPPVVDRVRVAAEGGELAAQGTDVGRVAVGGVRALASGVDGLERGDHPVLGGGDVVPEPDDVVDEPVGPALERVGLGLEGGDVVGRGALDPGPQRVDVLVEAGAPGLQPGARGGELDDPVDVGVAGGGHAGERRAWPQTCPGRSRSSRGRPPRRRRRSSRRERRARSSTRRRPTSSCRSSAGRWSRPTRRRWRPSRRSPRRARAPMIVVIRGPPSARRCGRSTTSAAGCARRRPGRTAGRAARRPGGRRRGRPAASSRRLISVIQASMNAWAAGWTRAPRRDASTSPRDLRPPRTTSPWSSHEVAERVESLEVDVEAHASAPCRGPELGVQLGRDVQRVAGDRDGHRVLGGLGDQLEGAGDAAHPGTAVGGGPGLPAEVDERVGQPAAAAGRRRRRPGRRTPRR